MRGIKNEYKILNTRQSFLLLGIGVVKTVLEHLTVSTATVNVINDISSIKADVSPLSQTLQNLRLRTELVRAVQIMSNAQIMI